MAVICFDPKFGWDTIVQIVAFGGGIWGILHQLKRQRELQSANHRSELQIGIYEKITDQIENSSPVGVSTTLDILANTLDEALKKAETTKKYIPPPFNVENIQEMYLASHQNLWKVIYTLEKYEIISPNLGLFREVIATKAREMSQVYGRILPVLPYLIVSQKGITDPEKIVVPTPELITKLKETTDEFREAAYDIAAYLHDIKIECQNILLREFFDNKVPIRSPEDKTHLVLTSEDKDMVEKAKKLSGRREVWRR